MLFLMEKLSSYQRLLEKANLPILYNRRLHDIYSLMNKVKHNLCPRHKLLEFSSSNFQGAPIRPIVPSQKRSVVFILHK